MAKRTGLLELFVGALLSACLAGAALAATVTGTEGDDYLTGTAGADEIGALGGDDAAYARGGDDVVLAGEGDDRGTVDAGGLSGGGGEDVMRGGAGNDSLHGDGEYDRVFAGEGRDFLSPGNGGRNSGDLYSGGPGDDHVDAEDYRGGRKDVVRCGPGRDTASLTGRTPSGAGARGCTGRGRSYDRLPRRGPRSVGRRIVLLGAPDHHPDQWAACPRWHDARANLGGDGRG